jgi:hypothetical protein
MCSGIEQMLANFLLRRNMSEFHILQLVYEKPPMSWLGMELPLI